MKTFETMPRPTRFKIAELPPAGIEYALGQIFGPGPYLTDAASSPASSWAKIGPLIDSYKIGLEYYFARPSCPGEQPYWVGRYVDLDGVSSNEDDILVTHGMDGVGDTPQEAIARAVLASIFGEHIWIPADVIEPAAPAATPSDPQGAA